jgi:hypothetical protein
MRLLEGDGRQVLDEAWQARMRLWRRDLGTGMTADGGVRTSDTLVLKTIHWCSNAQLCHVTRADDFFTASSQVLKRRDVDQVLGFRYDTDISASPSPARRVHRRTSLVSLLA